MTNIGITGYSGHIGQELLQFPNVIPLAGDVRIKSDIARAVNNNKVDIIVHLASISDVDKCEKPENQALVDETNVRGTFNVAEVAEEMGCEMVLLSTVHVFDGKRGNYRERDRREPVNYYGFTKLACENFREIFKFMKVVRTSYLFDRERLFPHIYPLREGHSLEYPTFIERSFMYLPHFAEVLYEYLNHYDAMPKMLHISGSHTGSWFTFMQDLAIAYGVSPSLICPRTNDIQTQFAPRPFRAGLNVDLSKKLGLSQYNYREGLQEMRNAGR